MLDFYEWTGDKQYMARIPEALDWLASVRLSGDEIQMPGREFPTFVEIGTNRALINHRRGSNVVNGAYYQDYSTDEPIVHYSQWRAVDFEGLQARYESLLGESPEDLKSRSPFNRRAGFELPQYFTTQTIEVSDLNSNAGASVIDRPDDATIAKLLDELNEAGYWPTPLRATSNPYIGDGDTTPADGDFSQTRVGDSSDTSPYIDEEPVLGISLGSYIRNMSALMLAVQG